LWFSFFERYSFYYYYARTSLNLLVETLLMFWTTKQKKEERAFEGRKRERVRIPPFVTMPHETPFFFRRRFEGAF